MPKQPAQIPEPWSTYVDRWRNAELVLKPSGHVYYVRVRAMLAYMLCLPGAEHWKDWKDIPAEALTRWIRFRQSNGNSPADTKKGRSSFSLWLRFMERSEGLAPIRSANLPKAPRVESRPAKALDGEAVATLLHLAQDVHSWHPDWGILAKDWAPGAFALAVRLALEVGLRSGEVLYLSRNELELDLDPPGVRLKNTDVRRLKNGFAGLPLAMSPFLAQACREYIAAHCTDHTPWLFLVPDRRNPAGWRSPRWDQIWKKLREKLDVEGLNGLMLRRTMATQIANRAKTPMEWMRAMRHSDPRTATAHYVMYAGENELIDPRTGQVVRRTV